MKTLFTVCLCLICSCALLGTEVFVDAQSPHASGDGSPTAPFKTINAALNATKKTGTITLKQGIYRERLLIFNKKTEEPLVIQAAPGTRPVLSGFTQIKNWTKGKDGLYQTTVNFLPKKLLVNGIYQQLSRYPETGWLLMKNQGNNIFTTTVKEMFPAGASMFVWLSGNVFGTVTLKATLKPGTLEVVPMKRNRLSKTSNEFYFTNHPQLIRKKGQWAWQKLDKNSYQIFLKWDESLDQQAVEVCGAYETLQLRNCKNVTIKGIDIIGSYGSGARVLACNNVLLKQIGFFWNDSASFVRGTNGLTVDDCRISANFSGVTCMDSQNIVIRKCDVGFNYEDGLRLTWKTKHSLLEGNRLHHQLWRGHPDCIQIYRDVYDVTLKNNLIFAAFQGLMCEQLNTCNLENNIFAGSNATQVIWGHGSSDNITMSNNTILHGGWGGVTVTGKGNNYHHNIIQGINFHGYQKDRDYVGSNNVYIKESKRWSNSINKSWPWTFDEYLKLSGETDSVLQLLPIEGMPVSIGVIDTGRMYQCTPEKLVLRRGNIRNVKINDTIEFSFDGVPRKVTAIEGDTITINPPFKYTPAHGYVFMNWKDNQAMKWAPKFTKKVGSSLNWEDIRIDRCTSVPMPKNVQHFIDNIDLLMP